MTGSFLSKVRQRYLGASNVFVGAMASSVYKKIITHLKNLIGWENSCLLPVNLDELSIIYVGHDIRVSLHAYGEHHVSCERLAIASFANVLWQLCCTQYTWSVAAAFLRAGHVFTSARVEDVGKVFIWQSGKLFAHRVIGGCSNCWALAIIALRCLFSFICLNCVRVCVCVRERHQGTTRVIAPKVNLARSLAPSTVAGVNKLALQVQCALYNSEPPPDWWNGKNRLFSPELGTCGNFQLWHDKKCHFFHFLLNDFDLGRLF